MTPITTILLFTANRFCYWLTAGNIEVRPQQTSTARNEPSAARKSHSTRLLSTTLRPFGLNPHKAYGFFHAPAAPSSLTKSP